MKATTIFLSIFSIFLILVACSQDGMSPQFDNSNPELAIENSVSKKPARSTDLISDNRIVDSYDTGISVPGGEYPQYASCTVTFNEKKQIYGGSTCQLPNGSSFEFFKGALTPPADHPYGTPVTITMRADLDETTKEIVFTFGPSGCKFEPSAEVWFKWADLGSPSATLFYLDSEGNHIEELPDNVEMANKQMCLYIDHFSRYAVAYSD